ncbi:MAG TPA: KTSC domain-containing protein [Aggregatilinea sp.]|uniref:KTSC domain-containing protein n=1 Tax=Aggregatilinea sp. TaxID=2806333 RepID=UPI002BE53149|nr:KTSC domain-containing protein [Aggregatilinea sp.]HML23471.1 KTSC domain-containing protein [Aggregatilinea sp.]
MNRVTVTSDTFHSVGYDSEECLMEVELRDGRIMLYNDVPIAVYEDFMRSAEKNAMTAYFNDYILDKYGSSQVEPNDSAPV